MSESNTVEYCAYCEADTPARYVCVLCDNNICSEHWLVSDRKDGKEVCRECAGDPEHNPDGSDVKCFWCNSRWVDTFDPDHNAWIHKECDPNYQGDDNQWVCGWCNIDVDDYDAPNIYPYKKCSVCSERSSCGSYNSDKQWVCEGCSEPEDCCPHCGEEGYWESEMSVKECCKYCEGCKKYKSSALEGWTYSEDGDLCPDCNA